MFWLFRPSLSARRAWIEIERPTTRTQGQYVALRKESVDRNSIVSASLTASTVALRKESVDRNSIGRASFRVSTVALRKESVDRNSRGMSTISYTIASLSARRAWIEIPGA